MIVQRLLLASATLAFTAVLTAQPVTYSTRTTTVRAGVLVVDSHRSGSLGGYVINNAPFVWANLDQLNTVKPSGWVLENPRPEITLSLPTRNRWVANPGAGAVPPVGTNLGKQDAPYWEVNLSSASADQLAQYDVLVFSVAAPFELNTLDREKLRRFVDKGGVLWVDYMPGAIGLSGGEVSLPTGFQVVPGGGTFSASPFHPLVRRPFSLSVNDIGATLASASNLSTRSLQGAFMAGAAAALYAGADEESNRFESVVANPSGSLVAVNRLGDGFFVLSTLGATATLNAGFDRNIGARVPNTGFRGVGPSANFASVAAARLATNVISLATEYGGSGGGARQSSSIARSVGAPALRLSAAPTGNDTRLRTPAVVNNLAVVRVGTELRAYDMIPGRNLDNDPTGNPDDGIADPAGSTYDLVWSANVGATFSDPVVVDVPGSLGATQQVWIVLGDSRVLAYNLNGLGVLTPIASINPPPATQTTSSPNPITVHDGIGFVSDRRNDGLGRIWAIDLRSGSNLIYGAPWSVHGSGRFGDPVGAAAVGYIPIRDGAGGLDRVAYLATRRAPGRNAGLVSVWIGAKGDAPVSYQVIGSTLRVTTRAASRNLFLAPQSVSVQIVQPNGDPLSIDQTQTFLTGAVTATAPGVLDFTLTGLGQARDWNNSTASTADDLSLRVDYTLDWGRVLTGTTPGDNYVRGNINVVDGIGQRDVVAGPALSAAGTVGLNVVRGSLGSSSNGTFYIFREDGRGQFLVRQRFEFHNASTAGFPVKGGSNRQYREALVDEDNLNVAIPFLNGPIRDLAPRGKPTAAGDQFLVAATGAKTVFGQPVVTSAVLSFKADPGPTEFDIRIPSAAPNPRPGAPAGFLLKQPDLSASVNQGAPSVFAVLSPGANFTYEPIAGTNPLRARITMESLAAGRSGDMGACFSSNLPVVVERDGTDTVFEPEADLANQGGGDARGRFSGLNWFTIVQGFEAVTGPVVTGDSMFLGGQSFLPDVISGIFPPTPSGIVVGADAIISANDPFVKSNSVRPWHNQLYALDGATGPFDFTNARPATALRWPQVRGIESIDDLRVRVLQAATSTGLVRGVAAGNGRIVAITEAGVDTFEQVQFVVADSGRVSQFDPSGNPLWSTQATIQSGESAPNSTASAVRRLSEPTRLYRLSNGNYAIVDAGGDAVLITDATGREVRRLQTLRIHPRRVPEGASLSSPRELRRPMDVSNYVTRRNQSEVAAAFPGETLQGGATDELWDHWLIADAGNGRVVELIDRYRLDFRGQIEGLVRYAQAGENEGDGFVTAQGVLLWHTPENLSAKRYVYNSISRQSLPGASGPRNVYAFGFGNVEPSRGSFGLDSPGVPPQDRATGAGGVVLFDGSDTAVITEFLFPAIAANTFVGSNGSGGFTFNLPTTLRPVERRLMVGLRAVTVGRNPAGRPTLMVTLADGIYELEQDLVAAGNPWVVRWMLPEAAYVAMRRPRTGTTFTLAQLQNNPARFQPAYARRLESGDVLVVNSYQGRRFNSTDPEGFKGEVIVVDGRFVSAALPITEPGFNFNRPNLGFNSLSVLFELPPVQGIRGIVNPIFAERQ